MLLSYADDCEWPDGYVDSGLHVDGYRREGGCRYAPVGVEWPCVVDRMLKSSYYQKMCACWLTALSSSTALREKITELEDSIKGQLNRVSLFLLLNVLSVYTHFFFYSRSFAEIPLKIYFDNLAMEGSYGLLQPGPGRYLGQIYCFCVLYCNSNYN